MKIQHISSSTVIKFQRKLNNYLKGVSVIDIIDIKFTTDGEAKTSTKYTAWIMLRDDADVEIIEQL